MVVKATEAETVEQSHALAYDEPIYRKALEHVWIHSANWVELAEKQGLHVFERGNGCFLYDARGNEWIDGIAGLWVVNAGHGRREIGELFDLQLKQLAYSTQIDDLLGGRTPNRPPRDGRRTAGYQSAQAKHNQPLPESDPVAREPFQTRRCEPGGKLPNNGLRTHLPSRPMRIRTSAAAESEKDTTSRSLLPSPFGEKAAGLALTVPKVRITVSGTML